MNSLSSGKSADDQNLFLNCLPFFACGRETGKFGHVFRLIMSGYWRITATLKALKRGRFSRLSRGSSHWTSAGCVGPVTCSSSIRLWGVQVPDPVLIGHRPGLLTGPCFPTPHYICSPRTGGAQPHHHPSQNTIT